MGETSRLASLAFYDPALAPLLSANGPAARERALESLLVGHVQPVVSGVLARYRSSAIHPEDADDIAAAVNLQVVRRLQQLAPGDEPIQCFDSYVAGVTYNVVYAFLRRRFPQRARLKNRLRYVFAHDARFATWEVNGAFACGAAQWVGTPPLSPSALPAGVADQLRRHETLGDALQVLFERVGGPLRFDDVVRAAAEVWNVSEAANSDPSTVTQPDARSPAMDVENRNSAQLLWREVQELRPSQRAALLMNLRDVKGNNAVALLLIAGIAKFDEIARAMDISPQRLSEIWNDLPLADNKIAEALQVSRQQVINLRKSARERLQRRMAARNWRVQ